MSFLRWTNRVDAEKSIAAINVELGCPYTSENGYRMDRWAIITKSAIKSEWGFFGPEDRLGKTKGELMSGVKPGYTEDPRKPDDWLPLRPELMAQL